MVAAKVKAPDGHFPVWSGEFEDQQRAMARLKVIVPMALFVVLGLLYSALASWRSATSILLCAPFAMTGGVFALKAAGVVLSVSAAVGFIALLGQVSLAGLLVSTARALVDLAHFERRPVPSLTAGGYWTTDGNSSSVVFGVSMPLPVWNTGRTAIDAASVGLRVREVARDQLSSQARVRYEGALQVLEVSRATYEAYERGAIEKLPRLREMTEAAYKGGAANVLVLVDASRSATELEVGRIGVLSEVLHAEADALAAGGAL